MNEQTHTLVGGQILYGVHLPNRCYGEYCCIHKPSDHHMSEWTQNWRPDRRMMERICPHGIGHPDPDDQTTDRTHGCDGCCTVPEVNPYRDYYLASEECLRLCETVGVSKEEWDANQERYAAAIAACKELENR